MVGVQDARCFGCHRTDVLGLLVDHCHKHGHVRGLLCRACNTTLGFVKDNPATLRRLADYLERGPFAFPEGADIKALAAAGELAQAKVHLEALEHALGG